MEYWKEAQFIFPKKAGDSLWIEPGAWAALQLGAGVLHLDREFALVPPIGKSVPYPRLSIVIARNTNLKWG